MQIETTEINGFAIDTFNQHGLEEGNKQGVCPLCSHNRKPKNQKAKCASYDWERGLGTCHNCNTSFQLHTYKRKGKAEKTYVKPSGPPNATEYPEFVSDKVVEWFQTRGISSQTLTDLQISEGPEWMPQTGKTENVIKFNYFVGLSLIHI